MANLSCQLSTPYVSGMPYAVVGSLKVSDGIEALTAP